MSAVVVDASVVVDAILGQGVWAVPDDLHAHAGIDVEVLAVVRRLTLRGQVTASDAREAVDTLALLDIERHGLRRLLPRIWHMHRDITAYDAGYVALAEALGMPLLTLDVRLARTAERYCDVIVP